MFLILSTGKPCDLLEESRLVQCCRSQGCLFSHGRLLGSHGRPSYGCPIRGLKLYLERLTSQVIEERRVLYSI